MKTILAPIDFSDATDDVVAQAVTLAGAINGRIVLLSVIQPPLVVSDYGPLVDNLVEITAAGERAAEKRIEAVRSRIESDSLVVETELTTGSPIQAITDAAATWEPDYIVMGSHGHTAFYDFVVGSTTHGVLKRATCPVVIIPAQHNPVRETTAKPASKARSRTPAVEATP